MKDDSAKVTGPVVPGGFRRRMETVATVGLLLVAVGLLAPFLDIENETYTRIFKWVYSLGALTYLVARVAGYLKGPKESLRVRRLRRLEAWAGVAFCVGAFFWFYNAGKFGERVWTLFLVRETVVFTLAGAVIQIIASWMLVSALRKEQASGKGNVPAEKKGKNGKNSDA